MSEIDGNVTPADTTVSSGDSGVSKETNPTQASDELDQKLADLRDEMTKTFQTDLNQQKSALQKDQAKELKSVQDEYRETRRDDLTRIQDLTAAGMDDDERAVYLNKVRDESLDNALKRLEDLENQLTVERQVAPALQAYLQMGVDPGKLNTESPQALYESGNQGMFDLITEQKSEIEKLREQTIEPTKKREEVNKGQKVLTTQHSTPSGEETLADIAKSLSDQKGRHVSLGELYDLAETDWRLEQRIREYVQRQEEEK